MSPEIEHLISLQVTDREIQRLKAEIAELPKVVAAIEEKLAGTKTGLEKARAAVKTDEAAKRKYETAITDQRQKISKYRDQSLEVKTNDQYKALLHEIQFAETEIAANEDKILELMVNAEVREKEVKAAEVELKEETAEIEKEKKIAHDRTAEDEKALAEWTAKRDAARGAVDADLLRHYDRVLKFRGSGLAEVGRERIHRRGAGAQAIEDSSARRIGDGAEDVSVSEGARHSGNHKGTFQERAALSSQR